MLLPYFNDKTDKNSRTFVPTGSIFLNKIALAVLYIHNIYMENKFNHLDIICYVSVEVIMISAISTISQWFIRINSKR